MVTAQKRGRIRSWWGKLPTCIRTWIRFVVLPIVSALLALSVFGYWTYIKSGQWTPDHLVSFVGFMLDGAGYIFELLFSLFRALVAKGA